LPTIPAEPLITMPPAVPWPMIRPLLVTLPPAASFTALTWPWIVPKLVTVATALAPTP
jgi:hypothetical protein